jgi:hypothetical protein
MQFSEADKIFLRSIGVVLPDDPPPDGTTALLREYGIPVTRENYLMLAFAGRVPEEPLDGEIIIQMPKELQRPTRPRVRFTKADKKMLKDMGTR